MGHLARWFIPGNEPECLEKIRVRIEISYLILRGHAKDLAGSNLRVLMRSLKRIVRSLGVFEGGLSWELSCSKPKEWYNIRFIVVAGKSLYLKKVETAYYRLGRSKSSLAVVWSCGFLATWGRHQYMQATMQHDINPSKAQKSFSLSSNHYRLLWAVSWSPLFSPDSASSTQAKIPSLNQSEWAKIAQPQGY